MFPKICLDIFSSHLPAGTVHASGCGKIKRTETFPDLRIFVPVLFIYANNEAKPVLACSLAEYRDND